MTYKEYYRTMNVAAGGLFIECFAERFNESTDDWNMEVRKDGVTDYEVVLTPVSLSSGEDVMFDFLVDVEQDVAGLIHDITDEIENIEDGYDVSYETYIWLDDTGHGMNGAPYEMEDVLADKKEVKKALKKLVGITLNLIDKYYKPEVDESELYDFEK